MGNFFALLWVLIGPAVGYYVAKKRGGSVVIGVIVGALTGPCLSFLFVPLVIGLIDGGGSVKQVPQRGAGRSFSVDENPELGDKK